MNKIGVLDELINQVKSGEIVLTDVTEAEQQLRDIREIVREHLYEEIYNNITDAQTMYFAPEYDSWREFLSDTRDEVDIAYESVLYESYTEEELESLWQCSHVMEELSPEEIKDRLFTQITQLKIKVLLKKLSKQDSVEKEQAIRGVKARIKGLFSLLYEE